MIHHLLTQVATIKRWTYTEDSLGNKERTGSTTTTHLARLEQTDSQEIQSGQATEVSNWRVFFPAEASIDAEDQVIVDGRTYEVIGPPAINRLPRGAHSVEARLRYVA